MAIQYITDEGEEKKKQRESKKKKKPASNHAKKRRGRKGVWLMGRKPRGVRK